jgi:acyl-CoA thioesterase II
MPRLTFLDLLDLSAIGVDHFTSASPGRGDGPLFGGQVMAQALQAARLTTDEAWPLHSMHAYFLRPGVAREPLLLHVQRARDGRSFLSRRVNVSQRAGVILTLDASFHRPEGGPTWEVATRKSVPSRDLCEDDPWDPLSQKQIVPAEEQGRGRATAWLRTSDTLPDDPLLHQIALVYLSDRIPVTAGVRALPPEQQDREQMTTASLDHAMWFHGPVRADEWVTFDVQAMALADNRAVAVGTARSPDDHLVATVAQESLVRPHPHRDSRG